MMRAGVEVVCFVRELSAPLFLKLSKRLFCLITTSPWVIA